MKIECDVIRDVLPLYVDKVTSQKTNELVDEHLSECMDCQAELKKLETEEPLSQTEIQKNQSEQKLFSNLGLKLKQLKLKSFIKGIVLASGLLLVMYGIYMGLFQIYFVPAPADEITISNLADLGDDNIFYCINYDKANYFEETIAEINDNGELYLNVYRPIVKRENTANNGCRIFQRGEAEAFTNASVKAYYYGTPENRVLIWKEGLVIPGPTREIEEIIEQTYRFNISSTYEK